MTTRPADLSVSESKPQDQPALPEAEGPAIEPLHFPGGIAPPEPQRMKLLLHDSTGHPFLTLYEDSDGILQIEGDMSRVSEAAGSFVTQCLAMAGKKLAAGTGPSNLGTWLESQPLGSVIQPVAVNVMNMAWHAALAAGSCNCAACVSQPQR